MTGVDPAALDAAIANTRAHLLSLRNAAGHWEGELSSSALSTATAVVALYTVDAQKHASAIARGAAWLIANQNSDGGWGDTTSSKSNLSTTLLCWSALHLVASHEGSDISPRVFSSASRSDDPEGRENLAGGAGSEATGTTGYGASKVSAPEVREKRPYSFKDCIDRSNHWITSHVGSLEPEAIAKAVIARYGKDKTFSVPILMLCSICGTLGDGGWRRVLPLPFELAAFPRPWFGAIGLPVVSYALPALIAIGYTRFFHQPPAWWNPLRWLRAALWPRIGPMLKALQPSSGGYLEATPLTSFVTMALASADEKHHPCVPTAVDFLLRSERADGSWPIDTNLATWGTTLSIKALGGSAAFSPAQESSSFKPVRTWLLSQQYREVHPFTNAAPGGWAWTDLPGGVPDADDTSGALIALWHLCDSEEERQAVISNVEAGISWLLDLQNRDGGMPTFCRGWGTLPFDRSTPEITAHALWSYALWRERLAMPLQKRVHEATASSLRYLERTQRPDGSWHPLWFGNEHTSDEENPVHGTAMVLQGISHLASDHAPSGDMVQRALTFLLESQQSGGAWGGSAGTAASVEETANATHALSAWIDRREAGPHLAAKMHDCIARGAQWLIEQTRNGSHFPAAPIGLYFARLWYHEKLYPVIWTLGALQHAKAVLARSVPTSA